MFEMKVEGLDEAIKMLEKEQEGFNRWTDDIEKRAKELCNDSDYKRITFKPLPDSQIDLQLTDAEAIDCLIQAIREYMGNVRNKQSNVSGSYRIARSEKNRRFKNHTLLAD